MWNIVLPPFLHTYPHTCARVQAACIHTRIYTTHEGEENTSNKYIKSNELIVKRITCSVYWLLYISLIDRLQLLDIPELQVCKPTFVLIISTTCACLQYLDFLRILSSKKLQSGFLWKRPRSRYMILIIRKYLVTCEEVIYLQINTRCVKYFSVCRRNVFYYFETS